MSLFLSLFSFFLKKKNSSQLSSEKKIKNYFLLFLSIGLLERDGDIRSEKCRFCMCMCGSYQGGLRLSHGCSGSAPHPLHVHHRPTPISLWLPRPVTHHCPIGKRGPISPLLLTPRLSTITYQLSSQPRPPSFTRCQTGTGPYNWTFGDHDFFKNICS